MNSDLHDMDDFFRSAYRKFEEHPPVDLWEKINAGLDKKEPASKSRKFIWWTSTIVLFLLILAGLVLFDPYILKPGSGQLKDETNTTKNSSAKKSAKQGKINNGVISAGENRMISGKEQTNLNEVGEIKLLAKGRKVASASNQIFDDTKEMVTDDRNKVYEKFDRSVMATTNEHYKIDIPEKSQGSIQERIMMDSLETKSYPSKSITIAPGNQRFIQLSIDEPLLKNNVALNKKKGKQSSFQPYWLICAYGSYEQVNYKLDSDLPGNITSIQHGEVHEPSFTAGVLAIRQLTKKFGLQSGIVYSNTAIGISPQKLFALQDPAGDITFKYITSSGYAYIKPGLGFPPAMGDSLQVTEGKHALQFISIPVMLKYTVGQNKFTITPGAGIEANLITNAKVETEIENAFSPEIVFINKLEGAKSFYFSFVADAELRYKLHKNVSVSLRPVFRYALSPITKNNVVETFPYSFGLGFGLTRKF